MKAIGDFTVDFSWENGKPKFISINSCKGMPLYVDCNGICSARISVNGKRVVGKQISANTLFIPSKQGDKINIGY